VVERDDEEKWMKFAPVTQGFRRRMAPAAAALSLAACAAVAPASADDPSPESTEMIPTVVAERPESPSETQQGQVRMRLISQRRKTADDYASLGVTGINKPNAVFQRLRMGYAGTLPPYVQPRLDGMDMMLADSTQDGWLALYRTPLAEWAGSAANGGYRAVLYAGDGARKWELDLTRFLSRTDRLEIQDLRYADGKLYFNEACQSYSREAGGRCSSLLRVDVGRGTVDWRTPPLVSNNVLILHGPWVIAGYGFTAEPDFLHLIDRRTGAIVAKQRLDSAQSYLEVRGNRLHVVTYDSVYVFELPAA
jgi:hypothetical protein